MKRSQPRKLREPRSRTMTTLTLDELRKALESLTSPPLKNKVQDWRTHSIGLIDEDLGMIPNAHGVLARRVHVKVVEPKAHHKKGDFVFWEDPEPIGD